ncbi:hypothetical protein JQ604_15715 [Bradyrhizobium jicamae]|uniref:hypothetical protein n=1 Tax=Bradyrhizobium jicamae TaxID=280332 RepID=UPI001BA5856F|nr:hypothetical protein [Bradyrhizobium jicamae]MBR0753636.1 hypothetical protein [Bradyrhizobium jicamae]
MVDLKPIVHITGTERRYNAVAAVEHDGQWRLFMPFPKHRIQQAAIVGNDRLVCCSEDSEVCLIDWRSGKEIARRHISMKSSSGHVRVTDDAEFIVFYRAGTYLDRWAGAHSIHILQSNSLETMVEGDAVSWAADQRAGRIVSEGIAQPTDEERCDRSDLQILGKVTEDQAGHLLFICCDGDPRNAESRRRFCRIDRSDWSISAELIPNEAGPWIWLSPTGCYAIAHHLGVPSVDDGSVDRDHALRGVGYDEQKRNWHVLELWVTDPPGLKSLITTRKGLQTESIHDVIWEQSEAAFWIKTGTWSRSVEFQRVSVDGKLSPAFAFQRFRNKSYNVLQDIVDVTDTRTVEIQSHEDTVYLQRDWCESELPFRLIAEDEDGFRKGMRPYPPSRLVRKLLTQTDRSHVVLVRDFSKSAIVDALAQLTRDVRDRLSDLLQNDVFEVSFKVGKRTISETAFFARLTRERIPVASALRELLTVYLEVQPRVIEASKIFRQIWGPENQGALAPAMLALLRLSPDAHDVFRDYLVKRDGEHETYSTNTIMKLYIKETKWRDLAMIRFGIYFALIRHRDGIRFPHGPLDEYGLLRAAEKLIAPDQFAAEIVQELEQFVVHPGLDLGEREDLYMALRSSLELTDYGRATLPILAASTSMNLLRDAAEQGIDPAILDLLRYAGTKH